MVEISQKKSPREEASAPLSPESSSKRQTVRLSADSDLTAYYTERTVDALNQFSAYTRHTPTQKLDLRCEFDLPRFKDLKVMRKPTQA